MDQMRRALEKAGLTQSAPRPAAVEQMDQAVVASRLRDAAEDGLYNLLSWVMVGNDQLTREMSDELRLRCRRSVADMIEAADKEVRDVGQDSGRGHRGPGARVRSARRTG